MDDTWADRDLVLLEAIVSLFEESAYNDVQLKAIQERCGLEGAEFDRGMTALASAQPRFFDGVKVDQFDYPVRISSVSERARRTVGQWPNPDSLVERLVETLSHAADEASDPEQKSKLQQAAEFLGGAGRQIAISWVSGTLPHPHL